MPKTILFLALLLPAGAPTLHAQTEYHARLGAIGASTLLRDVIVDEITVRQSIAPMLALGASLPIGTQGYRVGLDGTLVSGKFHSRESGSNTDLGTLRTATLQLGLEGPMHKGFRWHVGPAASPTGRRTTRASSATAARRDFWPARESTTGGPCCPSGTS